MHIFALEAALTWCERKASERPSPTIIPGPTVAAPPVNRAMCALPCGTSSSSKATARAKAVPVALAGRWLLAAASCSACISLQSSSVASFLISCKGLSSIHVCFCSYAAHISDHCTDQYKEKDRSFLSMLTCRLGANWSSELLLRILPSDCMHAFSFLHRLKPRSCLPFGRRYWLIMSSPDGSFSRLTIFCSCQPVAMKLS